MTAGGKSAVQAAIKKHKALGWSIRKSAEWGQDRFGTLETIEEIEREVIGQLEEAEDYYAEMTRGINTGNE